MMMRQDNIEKFSTDPNDQAARWAARFLEAAPDDATEASFRLWRSAPENARAWRETVAVLNLADAFGDEFLAKEFESELLTSNVDQSGGVFKRVFPIAASLVAAIGLSLAVLQIMNHYTEDEAATIFAYSSKIGEIKTVPLPDGSRVTLDTNTEIQIQFDEERRSVMMPRGQAFFDVAENVARPFLLSTQGGDIVVTGTSFNVQAAGAQTIVELVTGEIALRSGVQEAKIRPQQRASMGAGEISAITTFDPESSLSWRTGLLRVDGARLGDVIDSLNRYSETEIVLAENDIASLSVTGDFDLRDRDGALRALTTIFPLSQREANGQILLERKD